MSSEAKKHFLSVLPVAVGAALVVIALLLYARQTSQDQGQEELYTIRGTAVEIALTAQAITLEDQAGKRYLITLLPETVILDEKGNKAVLSDIRTGFTVSIKGLISPERSLIPYEVRVVKP